jgi:glycosyltransferase involved in cell wall biosynthesis
MKVLLVNKFHYKKGGSETYYFALAEALQARGHEVIFFAMKDEEHQIPCEQEKYFVSNSAVQGGLKSKLNMVLHIAYSKEAYRNMKRLMQEEQPDLVILNLVHKQITLSILDAIEEANPKTPIFWTMHDLITDCPAYTMLDGNGAICEKCLGGHFRECVKNRCIKGSRLMSMLSKYEADYIRKKGWYDKVDLYICPSDFYRNKLTEGHFTKSKIVTLRNPLPIHTQFQQTVQRGDYLLYFGRLAREKGVKTLIDAAVKSQSKLYILGTGPIENELQEYAKGYDNIQFKGFQTGEPLKEYVRNSLCAVLPSEWYENGPYSAMEAMAMGKPLIVSDNGGLAELVEDGKNGFLYHAEEGADGLEQRIHQMRGLSDEEYRRMSNNATAFAKEKFNAEHYVEQIEHFAEEVSHVGAKEI